MNMKPISMSNFKENECHKQVDLIKNETVYGDENKPIFEGAPAGKLYRGKERDFCLQEGKFNLYKGIRNQTLKYFQENNISWWGGSTPTGHVLSSQIACLNHLMPFMGNKDAVEAIAENVLNKSDNYKDYKSLEVNNLANKSGQEEYISFEVVSDYDHLNELKYSQHKLKRDQNKLTRGSNCTSIDALISVKMEFKQGETKDILLIIEWKYTENYAKLDKSIDPQKDGHDSGEVRLKRYSELIKNSDQLQHFDGDYKKSIYFQEPFYQLMRQTLWAEQMIENKEKETIKADDFLHVHVIPTENEDLLTKNYQLSETKKVIMSADREEGALENIWKGCLQDRNKYVIIDPADFIRPAFPENDSTNKDLKDYLSRRYKEKFSL